MPDLYVDEDGLQSLSSTLSQRVDHMEAIIDTIPMMMKFLANTWEGEAARAALNRMRIDEEALRESADALSRARELLDDAIRTYEETEQPVSSLWCFPWDTTIQRARPGKDPFARVFEYLHTALHQQGVLLAPPRLVDGEELPEDHPLSPANITQMRGSFLDPVTKFLPSKERS